MTVLINVINNNGFISKLFSGHHRSSISYCSNGCQICFSLKRKVKCIVSIIHFKKKIGQNKNLFFFSNIEMMH